MSLATLYNPPETERDLFAFSFSNTDHHRLIISAISTQKSIDLALMPLDPIPMFDVAGWARRHQQMHVDFTSVLGITGADLSDVDFNDQAQLEAWVRLHADEHRQADDLLGIGR